MAPTAFDPKGATWQNVKHIKLNEGLQENLPYNLPLQPRRVDYYRNDTIEGQKEGTNTCWYSSTFHPKSRVLVFYYIEFLSLSCWNSVTSVILTDSLQHFI